MDPLMIVISVVMSGRRDRALAEAFSPAPISFRVFRSSVQAYGRPHDELQRAKNRRLEISWFRNVLSGENKDFFPQLEKPTCTLVVTLFDFDQLGRSNLHDKRNMEPRRLCRAWRRAVSSRFSVLLSGRSMCSIVGIMHLFDSGGRGEGSWSLKEPTGESSRET